MTDDQPSAREVKYANAISDAAWYVDGTDRAAAAAIAVADAEQEALRREFAHMTETLRLRTAALHRVQRSNDQSRRECLDREATEQDVRARLADAEKALARVEGLTDGLCDCGDESCLEWAWGNAIRAALGLKP